MKLELNIERKVLVMDKNHDGIFELFKKSFKEAIVHTWVYPSPIFYQGIELHRTMEIGVETGYGKEEYRRVFFQEIRQRISRDWFDTRIKPYSNIGFTLEGIIYLAPRKGQDMWCAFLCEEWIDLTEEDIVRVLWEAAHMGLHPKFLVEEDEF